MGPYDNGNHDSANPRSLMKARRATGPRTAAGKKRSSRNALKRGMFSRILFLQGESPVEYKELLNGLVADLQPQGTTEAVCVENLAWVIWQRRRLLRAQNAEIFSAVGVRGSDSMEDQWREAWDLARAGETSDGMLKYQSNPFACREAIQRLVIFRNAFEKAGFQIPDGTWWLRKLYGTDRDGEPPRGIFRTFLLYQALATDTQTSGGTSDSPHELKMEMLQLLDEEIDELKEWDKSQSAVYEIRRKYQMLAECVLPQETTDRFLRLEAHLSREFGRILGHLERLQARRRGQPGPSTMNVEIST